MRRGPHWLLNDADAKNYGMALANALRHLPVTAAQKYVDFAALGIAVAAYEGPRIAMDVQLRAQRRQPQRPIGPAQIFQFRPQEAAQSQQQRPAPAASEPIPASYAQRFDQQPPDGRPANAFAGDPGILAEGPPDYGADGTPANLFAGNPVGA